MENVLSEKEVVIGYINKIKNINIIEISKIESRIELDESKKKSGESIICGIKRNNKILDLINDILNGDYSYGNVKDVLCRLEYKRKVSLVEVSKKEVIEKDLIDRVIIKKVNGVNKYYVEE